MPKIPSQHPIREQTTALEFLERLPRDYRTATILRQALSQELYGAPLFQLSDLEVRAQLAARLAFGPLRAQVSPYRLQPYAIGGDKPKSMQDIPQPGGGGGIAPAKKTKRWVDFKVVWAEPGTGVAGAAVKIRYLKDGKNVEEVKTTDAQGIIQINDIGDANTVEILEIKMKETAEALMVKSVPERAPNSPNK